MKSYPSEYLKKLINVLEMPEVEECMKLANLLYFASVNGKNIFLCGNGGSAGNAIHLANDFLYGVGKKNGRGLKVEALSANPAVITCLANDVGYDFIYSEQLKVKGSPDDILIVLSGSGNSPNVIQALITANKLGMKTCAITGYGGGECKKLAQLSLHIPVNDMQIAEDMQLIIGHICMRWLLDQN